MGVIMWNGLSEARMKAQWQDPAYRAKMQAAQDRRREREAKAFIDGLSYEEKSYLLKLGVLNSSFRLSCKDRPITKIKGYLNGYKVSEAAAKGADNS